MLASPCRRPKPRYIDPSSQTLEELALFSGLHKIFLKIGPAHPTNRLQEKNSNNSQKREKSLKSIGSLKQKRPSEVQHPVKVVRTETSRQYESNLIQLDVYSSRVGQPEQLDNPWGIIAFKKVISLLTVLAALASVSPKLSLGYPARGQEIE
ncbi:unnamed protein product [Lactuca saligna]|uniref:Uncharacterized protein n=1 Tax=Lactuca saligna TaxID=75948 RepID=A0AA35ZIJ3_LACSI|nr:unnamed protein product [Lactuca saligna]